MTTGTGGLGVRLIVTNAGFRVELGPLLARGGYGSVYRVLGHAELVYKQLAPKARAEDPTLHARLEAMAASPPSGWRETKGHVLLAWPVEVGYVTGELDGFLMPMIPIEEAVELHSISNPSDRRSPDVGKEWTTAFNWKYLVATANNLAQAVESLHAAGVVMGDFNERNVLVWKDARVSLLDCDSMQVSSGGNHFLCRVGRPEYTAPELLQADWKTTVRSSSSDLFGLAVHLHQLLMQGSHPFDGIWSGRGDKPRRHVLARDGLWSYTAAADLRPQPQAPLLDVLSPAIQTLFQRALVDGAHSPRLRPTANEWREALTTLGRHLTVCGVDTEHIYSDHLTACPWCPRKPIPPQTSLPQAAASTPLRSSYQTARVPIPSAPPIVRVPPVAGPIAPIYASAPNAFTPSKPPAPGGQTRRRQSRSFRWPAGGDLGMMVFLWWIACILLYGIYAGICAAVGVSAAPTTGLQQAGLGGSYTLAALVAFYITFTETGVSSSATSGGTTSSGTSANVGVAFATIPMRLGLAAFASLVGMTYAGDYTFNADTEYSSAIGGGYPVALLWCGAWAILGVLVCTLADAAGGDAAPVRARRIGVVVGALVGLGAWGLTFQGPIPSVEGWAAPPIALAAGYAIASAVASRRASGFARLTMAAMSLVLGLGFVGAALQSSSDRRLPTALVTNTLADLTVNIQSQLFAKILEVT